MELICITYDRYLVSVDEIYEEQKENRLLSVCSSRLRPGIRLSVTTRNIILEYVFFIFRVCLAIQSRIY
eukprot:GSA120T00009672001.1